MQEKFPEAFLMVMGATAIILILITLIISYLFISDKRKNQHRQQLLEINSQYEKTLLESQLKIQEETFRVISQNLHDNIGSTISTAMLLLYKDDQTTADELESNRKESLNMLDRVVDDLKNISRSLNADYLEDIGLSEAIRQRMEQLGRSKKYEIDLNMNDMPQRLNSQKQVLLFYIFQEIINNIHKHARAKKISVNLHYGKDELMIQIKDDGIGMNIAEFENTNAKGSGLINMKHHATLMSANLSIQSENRNGTAIILTVPAPYQIFGKGLVNKYT
jgi:two-component system, NarL family, sensor kinase